MEKRKIPFVDRLKDRGFVDQWGFILFALAGSVGIIAAKWFGLNAWWVAGGAISAMLIYAIVINRSGSGKLRADQAGDNCYYLGLIFTLASLSFAIATFDPNDTATTIVQGFGVALATTVLGLVLRVFFNQGRPDLENVEEQARLELTDASSQLKSEVSQVVENMNELSRQIQQSMSEARDAAVKQMTDFTTTSIEGIREVVEVANETIRAEANDFAKRSKRYDASFDQLLSKLENHADHIEGLNEMHEKLNLTSESLKVSSQAAQASVESFADHSEAVAANLRSIRDISAAANELISGMRIIITEIEGNNAEFRIAAREQLDAISNNPSEAVAGATNILNQIVAKMQSDMEDLTARHGAAVDNLAAQSEAAFKTAKSHNSKLEDELERSSQNVAKVHASLADMTGELIDQVRART